MQNNLSILFIGDVFGSPGRNLLKNNLPDFIKKNNIDLVIANGENLAGGLGITEDTAKEIISYGVNVITTGNHVYEKHTSEDLFSNNLKIIRPINYPERAPGKGFIITEYGGVSICVMNALGRLFMDPIDCPFLAVENTLQNIYKKTKIIIVDFHAEATAEKQALGWFLDGRVSAVLGTHTHVQTADERILPQGTAYISDVGMTGSTNSTIGVKKENMIKRFIERIPTKFEVAKGMEELNAVLLNINIQTGLSENIKRIKINMEEMNA